MELIPQIGPILSYIPALILAVASSPLEATQGHGTRDAHDVGLRSLLALQTVHT